MYENQFFIIHLMKSYREKIGKIFESALNGYKNDIKQTKNNNIMECEEKYGTGN